MMFCILCADHINTTFREQITNISLTLETNWHTYRMRISRLAFFLCIRILDSTYIISKPFSWKFLNTTHASPFRNDLYIFYIDEYNGFSLLLWSAYFAFYVLFNMIVVLKSFYHFICFFIVYVKISFYIFCSEDLSCILLLVYFYFFSSIWKVEKMECQCYKYETTLSRKFFQIVGTSF